MQINNVVKRVVLSFFALCMLVKLTDRHINRCILHIQRPTIVDLQDKLNSRQKMNV